MHLIHANGIMMLFADYLYFALVVGSNPIAATFLFPFIWLIIMLMATYLFALLATLVYSIYVSFSIGYTDFIKSF